jgi:signal transduction histidine kinase
VEIRRIDNEKINSLYEEIIRISKIVNDLDKLSFYDNNTITLDKQQFNIKTILLKIINNFDKELNNKNITINIQGEDIKIIADKDKITQVFINLISNAIKYTNNNGKIDICIDLNNKMARVVIKDNGIGISREDLPYIFERFYRADKSRTRSTGGSGIGLSIVKNIIDTHNGEIIIDSELHKGTSVTVLLPL